MASVAIDAHEVHELSLFVDSPNFAPLTTEPARRVLLRGPNRIGKTRHLAALAARRAIKGEGYWRRGRFVSPTHRHVHTVAGEYLAQFLEPSLAKRSYYVRGKGWNSGNAKSILLANGYEIELMSLKDDVDAHEGRGMDWVIMDEPPTPEHLTANASRLLDSEGQLLIGATMVNKPVKYLREMVEGKDETPKSGRTLHASGWVQYVASLSVETCPWYSDAQLAEWRHLLSASPWDYDQRINGAWEGTTEGRRFVLFTEKNVSREGPTSKGWRIGLWMDHGEVIGHQVCLLVAHKGPKVCVLREYRNEIATSPEQDARHIRDMLKAEGTRLAMVDLGVGDTNTAGKGFSGKLMNKVLEQAFLDLHNARTGGRRKTPVFKIKAANKLPGMRDWSQRIVNHACHRGDLTIHPRCRHLLDTMRNWQGGVTPKTDDAELSHMADALCMGILEALRDQPTYSRLQFNF